MAMAWPHCAFRPDGESDPPPKKKKEERPTLMVKWEGEGERRVQRLPQVLVTDSLSKALWQMRCQTEKREEGM